MSSFWQDQQCVFMCTGMAFTGMLKQRHATLFLCKDTAAFGGSEALYRMVQCCVCVFLCVCVCVKTGIVAHQVSHLIVGTGVNRKSVLLKL